jgi:hypothetical protein
MPCIIVRRGDYQQYDCLYRVFGDRVPVVWDRRRSAAHRPNAPVERRSPPPPSWQLGFVVVDRPTDSPVRLSRKDGAATV